MHQLCKHARDKIYSRLPASILLRSKSTTGTCKPLTNIDSTRIKIDFCCLGVNRGMSLDPIVFKALWHLTGHPFFRDRASIGRIYFPLRVFLTAVQILRQNFLLSSAQWRNKVIHILSYASLLFFKISLLCLLE